MRVLALTYLCNATQGDKMTEFHVEGDFTIVLFCKTIRYIMSLFCVKYKNLLLCKTKHVFLR